MIFPRGQVKRTSSPPALSPLLHKNEQSGRRTLYPPNTQRASVSSCLPPRPRSLPQLFPGSRPPTSTLSAPFCQCLLVPHPCPTCPSSVLCCQRAPGPPWPDSRSQAGAAERAGVRLQSPPPQHQVTRINWAGGNMEKIIPLFFFSYCFLHYFLTYFWKWVT